MIIGLTNSLSNFLIKTSDIVKINMLYYRRDSFNTTPFYYYPTLMLHHLLETLSIGQYVLQ